MAENFDMIQKVRPILSPQFLDWIHYPGNFLSLCPECERIPRIPCSTNPTLRIYRWQQQSKSGY